MLIILLACIISGILYRAGGMGKGDECQPTWIPVWMRESWVRDWLCPLVFLVMIWLLGVKLHWTYLLFWGLSGMTLSTYWDELFGYDNFFAHGCGIGLVGFILYSSIPLYIIIARLIICTLGMGLWSKYIKTDVPQEMGRGVIFIL